MKNRINHRFNQCVAEKRAALIPFLTAGYPNLQATLPLMQALVGAGADIIELGVPFSDPMADGPIIEAAGHQALAEGTNFAKVLAMVEAFRQKDTMTPVVLMGYANPIECFGLEKFAQQARVVGVDGVLVVDLPPEESVDWQKAFSTNDLAMIHLVAPNTPEARIDSFPKQSGGFLYTVSIKGVTGSATLNTDEVRLQVERIRAHTTLPIAVGFGVRTPGHAKAIGHYADGVIIGSRLIEVIRDQWAETPDMDKVIQAVRIFLAPLKAALR